MNLVYFSDDRGRILTEMSCLRLGEDHFTLITVGAAQWHDSEILKHALPKGLILEDQTTDFGTMIVTGAKLRPLRAGLSDADLSLGRLSHQSATVAGKPAFLIRVSFAGELGWEVHCANADQPEICAAILAGGATPFGMYALNALRIEKGCRSRRATCRATIRCLRAGWNALPNWTKCRISAARRRRRPRSSRG